MGPTNNEFVRELLRRREIADRDLDTAKKTHQAQLHAIDTLLEAEGYSAAADGNVSSKAVFDTNVLIASSTTREFITRVLKDAGEPMKMSEIVDTVAKKGSPASHDTIRTVLQKMLRSKQVTRPDRGMYGLPEAPVTESPSQDVLSFVTSLGEVKTP